MKSLFWLAAATVAYTYVGYLLLLAVLARLRPRPVHCTPFLPTVSILVAAHNEAANLPAKLANLAQLDYPRGQLQIIVVSDGSSDATESILLEHAAGNPGTLHSILLAKPGGKAAALNRAVSEAWGDLLVFMDCRQSIEPDALVQLTACFADPTTGAVSGELLLEASPGTASDAVGIYWKIEKAVRKLESRTGSVVGVTGALYAIRRELFVPLPPGTLLDDVWVPMHVARAGYRVLFQPLAIARDRIFSASGKEFSRKVRTLTGNYQLLRLAPWLLSPRNPLLFRLISHKLLRLAVPFLLLLMLAVSSAIPGMFYKALFLGQLIFYGLAALGTLLPTSRRVKPVAIAATFTMLNLAAALALWKFARGRKVWV